MSFLIIYFVAQILFFGIVLGHLGSAVLKFLVAG